MYNDLNNPNNEIGKRSQKNRDLASEINLFQRKNPVMVQRIVLGQQELIKLPQPQRPRSQKRNAKAIRYSTYEKPVSNPESISEENLRTRSNLNPETGRVNANTNSSFQTSPAKIGEITRVDPQNQVEENQNFKGEATCRAELLSINSKEKIEEEKQLASINLRQKSLKILDINKQNQGAFRHQNLESGYDCSNDQNSNLAQRPRSKNILSRPNQRYQKVANLDDSPKYTLGEGNSVVSQKSISNPISPLIEEIKVKNHNLPAFSPIYTEINSWKSTPRSPEKLLTIIGELQQQQLFADKVKNHRAKQSAMKPIQSLQGVIFQQLVGQRKKVSNAKARQSPSILDILKVQQQAQYNNRSVLSKSQECMNITQIIQSNGKVGNNRNRLSLKTSQYNSHKPAVNPNQPQVPGKANQNSKREKPSVLNPLNQAQTLFKSALQAQRNPTEKIYNHTSMMANNVNVQNVEALNNSLFLDKICEIHEIPQESDQVQSDAQRSSQLISSSPQGSRAQIKNGSPPLTPSKSAELAAQQLDKSVGVGTGAAAAVVINATRVISIPQPEVSKTAKTRERVALDPQYMVSMVKPVVLSPFEKVDKSSPERPLKILEKPKQDYESIYKKVFRKDDLDIRRDSDMSVNTAKIIDLKHSRLQKLNEVVKNIGERPQYGQLSTKSFNFNQTDTSRHGTLKENMQSNHGLPAGSVVDSPCSIILITDRQPINERPQNQRQNIQINVNNLKFNPHRQMRKNKTSNPQFSPRNAKKNLKAPEVQASNHSFHSRSPSLKNSQQRFTKGGGFGGINFSFRGSAISSALEGSNISHITLHNKRASQIMQNNQSASQGFNFINGKICNRKEATPLSSIKVNEEGQLNDSQSILGTPSPRDKRVSNKPSQVQSNPKMDKLNLDIEHFELTLNSPQLWEKMPLSTTKLPEQELPRPKTQIIAESQPHSEVQRDGETLQNITLVETQKLSPINMDAEYVGGQQSQDYGEQGDGASKICSSTQEYPQKMAENGDFDEEARLFMQSIRRAQINNSNTPKSTATQFNKEGTFNSDLYLKTRKVQKRSDAFKVYKNLQVSKSKTAQTNELYLKSDVSLPIQNSRSTGRQSVIIDERSSGKILIPVSYDEIMYKELEARGLPISEQTSSQYNAAHMKSRKDSLAPFSACDNSQQIIAGENSRLLSSRYSHIVGEQSRILHQRSFIREQCLQQHPNQQEARARASAERQFKGLSKIPLSTIQQQQQEYYNSDTDRVRMNSTQVAQEDNSSRIKEDQLHPDQKVSQPITPATHDFQKSTFRSNKSLQQEIQKMTIQGESMLNQFQDSYYQIHNQSGLQGDQNVTTQQNDTLFTERFLNQQLPDQSTINTHLKKTSPFKIDSSQPEPVLRSSSNVPKPNAPAPSSRQAFKIIGNHIKRNESPLNLKIRSHQKNRNILHQSLQKTRHTNIMLQQEYVQAQQRYQAIEYLKKQKIKEEMGFYSKSQQRTGKDVAIIGDKVEGPVMLQYTHQGLQGFDMYLQNLGQQLHQQIASKPTQIYGWPDDLREVGSFDANDNCSSGRLLGGSASPGSGGGMYVGTGSRSGFNIENQSLGQILQMYSLKKNQHLLSPPTFGGTRWDDIRPSSNTPKNMTFYSGIANQMSKTPQALFRKRGSSALDF